MNDLCWTLIFLGHWDEAQRVIATAESADGLGADEVLRATVAFLAALRGDTEVSRAHADLPGLRGSEDPRALVAALVVDAFLAAASGYDTDPWRSPITFSDTSGPSG